MTSPQVADHAWWLASRASGLVALLLITASVVLGLSMGGRLPKKPGAKRSFNALHEHLAVAGLVAIAVHGVTLLGDAWLHPGWAGISVPFRMPYKQPWTGLGMIGGYLAAILGPSFYVRRRIGPRVWRKAHRMTIVVYMLAVAHTLGSGTDAGTPWMRWWFAFTTPLILILFVNRLVKSPSRASAQRRPVAAPAGTATAVPATAVPATAIAATAVPATAAVAAPPLEHARRPVERHPQNPDWRSPHHEWRRSPQMPPRPAAVVEEA